MKKNLLAMCFSALFATGVIAAEGETTMSQSVTFIGQVQESVCALSINGGDAVQLGFISNKKDQKGSMIPVSVILSDCDASKVTENKYSIKVQYASTTITNNQISTRIPGVVVSLYKDAAETPIDDLLTAFDDFQSFANGVAQIPFYARLESTTDYQYDASSNTIGQVQPVVTFDVTVK